MLAGAVMSGAAVAFTFGDTQGTLLTFATLAVVLGYIAACVALSQMHRRQIAAVWRRGLRGFVWGPPAFIVFGGIAIFVIYFLRGGLERARADAAETAAVQAARSEAAAVPVVPISTEEVFRKMNALANESNGEEFKKRMAREDPQPWNPNIRIVPMAPKMEPFFGRIISVKPAPLKGFDPRKVSHVFAAIERNTVQSIIRCFRSSCRTVSGDTAVTSSRNTVRLAALSSDRKKAIQRRSFGPT